METTQTEKKNFSIRPTTDAHERLKEAAGWLGQTLNSFVLGAALQKADDVLTNRDRIRLAPEDAELMINLMDAEPQPNEALAAAYKKRAEILGE
jgi:uncharacterized protein (DUF1778 family)